MDWLDTPSRWQLTYFCTLSLSLAYSFCSGVNGLVGVKEARDIGLPSTRRVRVLLVDADGDCVVGLEAATGGGGGGATNEDDDDAPRPALLLLLLFFLLLVLPPRLLLPSSCCSRLSWRAAWRSARDPPGGSTPCITNESWIASCMVSTSYQLFSEMEKCKCQTPGVTRARQNATATVCFIGLQNRQTD